MGSTTKNIVLVMIFFVASWIEDLDCGAKRAVRPAEGSLLIHAEEHFTLLEPNLGMVELLVFNRRF